MHMSHGQLVAVKRRCEEEPLAYITGYQTFWKHDFIVNPNVLIPRPCSEVVVETVVEAVTATGTANVLDICTGSGCLLLSVLGDCTNASGVGIDVSLEALDVARANSRQLSLSPRARFCQGDMLESVSFQRAVGRNIYDYIICNPPYVTTAEMETLPTSVRSFEPTLALAAGDDGLRFYRALVDRIDELRMAQNIAAGTMIVSEVGCGQANDVAELFSSLSFVRTIQVLKDLRGVQRAVKIIL